MSKRLFLMKGHPLTPRHMIAGRYLSEKLDGERAFWDGGVTAGLYGNDIPWANNAKSGAGKLATGLWTSNAKIIFAPNWFLERLPRFPLDLELWAGRGKFQLASSIVRKQDFSGDWSRITAVVLDCPHPAVVFQDGEIDMPFYKKRFRNVYPWWEARANGQELPHPFYSFRERYSWLQKRVHEFDTVKLHPQELLPMNGPVAAARVEEFMNSVLDDGGEGVILKSASCLWNPERNEETLKHKPWHDMEAKVVGYMAGRETDKGSRLLGMMGALICEIPAGRFKVGTGFDDDERVLSSTDVTAGDEVPAHIHSPIFPRGSLVTVRYRELTDSQVPKEGRFWRKFNPA